MYISPEQHKIIEDITGPVTRFRSKYMPDGERIAGLFNEVPFGFTGIWHLSMIMHPDCASSVISGSNPDMFNQFINELKVKHQYE